MLNWTLPIMRRVAHHWIALSTALLLAITALSLWPLETLPSVPGGDKTHHLIAYGALMFPAALRGARRWWVVGLVFIAWGGMIELIQPSVNRYGEWLDFVANSSGVLLGAVVALLFKRVADWQPTAPTTDHRAR